MQATSNRTWARSRRRARRIKSTRRSKKPRHKIVGKIVLLLSIVPMIASAQSGTWTDPATGLMWAAKDNGKDVSWNKAMKYCRDLRLAGFSDWRLAAIDELQG